MADPQTPPHTCIKDDGGTPGRTCYACLAETGGYKPQPPAPEFTAYELAQQARLHRIGSFEHAMLTYAASLKRREARLRAWMAEYPNDKYTGAWWLAEFDRMAASPEAQP